MTVENFGTARLTTWTFAMADSSVTAHTGMSPLRPSHTQLGAGDLLMDRQRSMQIVLARHAELLQDLASWLPL